ncbi:hypothetical protein ACFWW0_40630, partial [Streptomyces violascens]
MSRQLETTWAPEHLWTAAACGAALWAVWDSQAYALNGLALSGRPGLAGAVGAAAGLALLWHARRPVLVASPTAGGHLLAYAPGALGLAMVTTGTRVPERHGLVVPVAGASTLALVGIWGSISAPGMRETSVAPALTRPSPWGACSTRVLDQMHAAKDALLRQAPRAAATARAGARQALIWHAVAIATVLLASALIARHLITRLRRTALTAQNELPSFVRRIARAQHP